MPVHFLDARADQCRFPLWDASQSIGDVCGATALTGRPYCLACHQRTHTCEASRAPAAPRAERAPRFIADDVTPDLVEMVGAVGTVAAVIATILQIAGVF